MSRRTLLLILAAIAALALSQWLSRQAEWEQDQADRARRHIPDYFLTDFTATTMGPEGRPEHRLSAERLVHYADDDTSDLTQPRVVVFRTGENHWYARAERGKVGPGGEVVYLSDNVELYQPGSAGEAPLTVTTERLEIHPRKSYAETDAAVTLTGPGSRVEGTGLRAYFKQERLELLTEVSGIHEPR